MVIKKKSSGIEFECLFYLLSERIKLYYFSFINCIINISKAILKYLLNH